MDSTTVPMAVPMGDPPSEAYERLHPNARIAWVISTVIGVGVIWVIGIVAELVIARGDRNWPWPRWLPLVSLIGGGLLMAWSVVMAILAYARCGYRLRQRDLVVRSGVIWNTRRCVPRARIQHIDIKSGPIGRMLGIVDVQVYVAGGMGAVAELSGVSPQVAEELKEALIVSRTDGV